MKFNIGKYQFDADTRPKTVIIALLVAISGGFIIRLMYPSDLAAAFTSAIIFTLFTVFGEPTDPSLLKIPDKEPVRGR